MAVGHVGSEIGADDDAARKPNRAVIGIVFPGAVRRERFPKILERGGIRICRLIVLGWGRRLAR
jgi:hypothetical protein